VGPIAHRAHVSVRYSVFEVQIFYKSAYNNCTPRKHAALWRLKNTVVGYGDDMSYQWNDTVINP